MNTTNTTNPDRRSNYTVYSSTDGGRRWQWLAGVLEGGVALTDAAAGMRFAVVLCVPRPWTVKRSADPPPELSDRPSVFDTH